MRTAKQEALEGIQGLPDNASFSEIFDALKRISSENRRSMQESDGVSLEGERAAGSCHELLGDLLGSVEAERDLSTNDRYLDEYGK